MIEISTLHWLLTFQSGIPAYINRTELSNQPRDLAYLKAAHSHRRLPHTEPWWIKIFCRAARGYHHRRGFGCTDHSPTFGNIAEKFSVRRQGWSSMGDALTTAPHSENERDFLSATRHYYHQHRTTYGLWPTLEEINKGISVGSWGVINWCHGSIRLFVQFRTRERS